MTGRNPKLGHLRRVKTARANVLRCDEAAAKAREHYRKELREAAAAGVTKADLARLLDTSESRVRQEILRGHAEAS